MTFAVYGLQAAAVRAADVAPGPTPQALLERGEVRSAWKLGRATLAGENADADVLVSMAKAALAKAKTASLLSKKRWAVRGRDAYRAALALNPDNADALLGLATFALRAPDGLGGGQETLAQLRAQLLDVSAPHSLILAAREAAKRDDAAALDHYEVALLQLTAGPYFSEYIKEAKSLGVQQRAYDFVATQSDLSPCTHFFAGRLASDLALSEQAQLGHHIAFLETRTQFCARSQVDKAVALAAASLVPEGDTATEAFIQARLAEIKAQSGDQKSRESSR
ncbi:MAG: hypothetical protein AAF337_00815 [Pseudomonadota bacterium]